MSYIKKLTYSILPIIRYIVLSYLVIFISYFIFYILGYRDVSMFINNYGIYINLIFNIVYIFILSKKYRVRYMFSSKYIYHLLILGVGLSLFLNNIILLIRGNGDIVNVNKIVLMISSVIVGPIIEEIIYRYILISKLRCFNSRISSVIISSVIFSLSHNNIYSIIYSLILGLVLGVIYIRKVSVSNFIIVHSFANLSVLFIKGFNSYILLLSFILLIISVKILKRDYFIRQ